MRTYETWFDPIFGSCLEYSDVCAPLPPSVSAISLISLCLSYILQVSQCVVYSLLFLDVILTLALVE